MDEGHAARLGQRVAMGLCLRVAISRQHDLSAEIAHRGHFDLRRRPRHHDSRVQPEMTGGERDTLGMIAGARRNHSPGPLVLGEVGDAVVCASQLEAEARLQVFALEQHLVREPPGEPGGRLERCLLRHVVNAAGQDQAKHLIRSVWLGARRLSSCRRHRSCGAQYVGKHAGRRHRWPRAGSANHQRRRVVAIGRKRDQVVGARKRRARVSAGHCL